MPDINTLNHGSSASVEAGSTLTHSMSFVDISEDAIPCHPLGVKPSGNGLLAKRDLRTAIGNFKVFSDELILILLEYLDAVSLLSIGRSCKAFYAFTRAEELWKALFIG